MPLRRRHLFLAAATSLASARRFSPAKAQVPPHSQQGIVQASAAPDGNADYTIRIKWAHRVGAGYSSLDQAPFPSVSATTAAPHGRQASYRGYTERYRHAGTTTLARPVSSGRRGWRRRRRHAIHSAARHTPHCVHAAPCRISLLSHASRSRQRSDRGLYNGQVGLVYVEPRQDVGAYDREVFLTLKEFGPFLS